MKNLFDAASADQVKVRLGQLRQESPPLWAR